MDINWPIRKLQDIADIRVSNVDKKVHTNEKPVKLCNYLDVYTNEYITSRIEYMEASASSTEIERFSLKYGDVIITKDSETPDDIGIPAVITESINDLVCGYHLALIRPKADQLIPIYLSKQLSTSRVARYFAIHASGSTRYGLPISAIESIEIPTPPIPEQNKIAEILSTVDRAIEQTEALITKQQRIKTGLMQDLLTRGIDGHGNLRSEQTHQFKDSPLGRIPVEWEATPLGELVHIKHGYAFAGEFFSDQPNGYVLLTPGNFHVQGGLYFTKSNTKYYTGQIPKGYILSNGDVLVVMTDLTKEMAILGRTVILNHSEYVLHNQRIGKVEINRGIELDSGFLALLMDSDQHRDSIKVTATGTTVRHTSPKKLLSPFVPNIGLDEQLRIRNRVEAVDKYIGYLNHELLKSKRLKTALMQDLLTGKKRVAPLLNDMEVLSR